MVNGKHDSVNSARRFQYGNVSCGKSRQPDESPTRMRAISPPRNSAARIHSATCGRLRISPRGGSFCCANSRESVSLSSVRRSSPAPEAGALAVSWGSSLNSRGTATMLAPKKSGRQEIVYHRSIGERRPASVNVELRRNTARCARSALARQNSNQRECHDCTGEDCQCHPPPQLRMRFRQAEQMNRGILPVENFRAGRALRRREYFRRRPSLGGNSSCTFGNLTGHCPDTSTNATAQKQNFQRVNDFVLFSGETTRHAATGT
jgi:hypothetical protein